MTTLPDIREADARTAASSQSNPTVVFTGPGQVEVVERPVPTPGPGEVLIQTSVSLVSQGTELMILDGGPDIGEEWRKLRRFPYTAGYSNVGRVVEVGPGTAASWLGRRVDSHSPHAAFAVCAAAALRPVPDGVADEAAALASLAEVVMNGLRRAELTWGESVAVVGMGLLGQLAARIARLAGARPIFAIDPLAAKLAALPAGPPYVPLAGEADAFGDVVRARLRLAGVDVAVEASGNPRALPGQAGLLRPQGRLLVLSSPSGASAFDFHDLCNRKSLTIVGAHYFSHPPEATLDRPWSAVRHGDLFLEWLAAGDLQVDGLITHRFPVHRAAEAYALLRERRPGSLGLVLDWRSQAAA